MSKPRSICIPTYNRAGFLPDCLDSIAVQFENKEVRDQMEVVISDNASSDNTAEVVKKYTDKYPNIRYFRNAANVGFDKNLLNVVEKSVGEYCLPIGDDDAFFPDSFEFILEKIKTVRVPYYLINSWGYDHELSDPVLAHPNTDIEEDKVYTDLITYTRTIKKYVDLVGNFCGMSQIFKRDAWMRFQDKERYIGTNAVHYYILLSIFKNSPCASLAKPVIKTRSSNIRWNVFPGLEQYCGRAASMIGRTKWIRDAFNLPISNFRINVYFYTREYWFTTKEVVKGMLSKLGLGGITALYRKMR